MQTEEIERAKRRFQVVLEGLRILMNATSAQTFLFTRRFELISLVDRGTRQRSCLEQADFVKILGPGE